MNALRRTSALFEVFGVILAGPFVTAFIIRSFNIPVSNPLTTFTADITGPQLLSAAWQMFVLLSLQYIGYFALIIPINWWHRRSGPAAYGLTKAHHSWRTLLLAGIATIAIATLFASPASALLLANTTFHLGLGETVPWRQALFDTSWCRWEFWLFMAVASFGFVPLVEELFYRGYCQRRLAEDWGDSPAIIAATTLLAFTHSQYWHMNAYNIAIMIKVLLLALACGVVFAWTRSLIPSMIAHAIINIPLTPLYEMILLITLIVVGLLATRRGFAILKQIFLRASIAPCISLGLIGIAWAIAAHRLGDLLILAVTVIVIAVVLEAIERRLNQSATHPN